MASTATLLPFYALCDVSASMREDQRIEALNTAMAAACDGIALNPVVADRVRLGIIAFAAQAEVVVPLCDPGLMGDLPILTARSLTSYSAAFLRLRETIEEDVAQLVADGYRVFRPAVFFLTDGQPTDPAVVWRAALADLLDADFPHRPNVVAFGFGDADGALLGEIGTLAVYRAADAVTAATAIASFGALLVESVISSGAAGRLRLPADAPDGVETLAEAELL